ncbi:MAG: sigma-70 family RNA polymerase sigma factor [Porticoccaceae bacterium]
MPTGDSAPHDPVASLYNDHHRWLSGWLGKKLGCSAQAADIAQDTFLRVLLARHKSGQLPEFDRPRAYLITVASRLMHDLFRRQSLERAWLDILAQQPEAVAPSPQDQLIIREALDEIDALLYRLKPAVRSAFLLSQLEGLTYKQIALRMNICERTVKRHMAMAFEACILHMAD